MDIALSAHLLHVPWGVGVAALIGFGLATVWFVRSFRRAPLDPPVPPASGGNAADESAIARERRR